MLLEDGAASCMCVSGGPVHSHPDPEGLAVRTLSGSLPLPEQTSQRYYPMANLHCPTYHTKVYTSVGIRIGLLLYLMQI